MNEKKNEHVAIPQFDRRVMTWRFCGGGTVELVRSNVLGQEVRIKREGSTDYGVRIMDIDELIAVLQAVKEEMGKE